MGVKDDRRVCDVCGQSTHEGFLCRDHTDALEQGQIGKCRRCSSFLLIGEECRVCSEVDPKLFAGEIDGDSVEAISNYLRDQILMKTNESHMSKREHGGFSGEVIISQDWVARHFVRDRWGIRLDRRRGRLYFSVRQVLDEILLEHSNHRFIEVQDGSESKLYLVIPDIQRRSFKYFRLNRVESGERGYMALHLCAEPFAKEIARNMQKMKYPRKAVDPLNFRAVWTKQDWAVVLEKKPEEIEFHKW